MQIVSVLTDAFEIELINSRLVICRNKAVGERKQSSDPSVQQQNL